MNKIPSVTVITDASMCHKTGAVGWGAWAKHDGIDSKLFGGELKRLIFKSYEADMCAIANALHFLKKDATLMRVRKIYIQSDNVRALSIIQTMDNCHFIKRKSRFDTDVRRFDLDKITETERECLDFIKRITKNHIVHVRHVKGHQGADKTGRAWVNNQCDKIAKLHMQTVRERLSITRIINCSE